MPAATSQPRQLAAIEAVEARIDQRRHDLAHAVGAEVGAEHRIAVGHAGIGADDPRLDELVAGAGLVGRTDGGQGVVGAGGRGADDGLPGALDPLPSLVAVHGVVAARDRADDGAAGLQRRQDALEIARGRARRRVAPVEEGVQHHLEPGLPEQPAPGPRCGSDARARRPARRGPADGRGRCRLAPPSTSRRKPSRRPRSPVSTAVSMRGSSCITTRPAPRFMWPTSELPNWPSGRPTSRPSVLRKQRGELDQRRSNTGVRASAGALKSRSSR